MTDDNKQAGAPDNTDPRPDAVQKDPRFNVKPGRLEPVDPESQDQIGKKRIGG